ncbi:hypothetical protein BC332_17769 [Capsicum chinense]|nr:hypothetical protein BC332_17769 [Capsicum chinense]
MLKLANHFGTDLVGCLLKAGYTLFSKCGWFEQDFFVLLHLSRLHQGVSLIGRSRGLRKTLPSEELFLKLPLGREANILLAPSCLASLSLLSLAHLNINPLKETELVLYGGEFYNGNKDFWVLETNQWEQLNYKGCPSPHSGHRMILYKHKIIVFGGFYDTLREVRVPSGFVTHLQLSAFCSITMIFMYLYLDQYKWHEIKSTSGCMWPSARKWLSR